MKIFHLLLPELYVVARVLLHCSLYQGIPPDHHYHHHDFDLTYDDDRGEDNDDGFDRFNVPCSPSS